MIVLGTQVASEGGANVTLTSYVMCHVACRMLQGHQLPAAYKISYRYFYIEVFVVPYDVCFLF